MWYLCVVTANFSNPKWSWLDHAWLPKHGKTTDMYYSGIDFGLYAVPYSSPFHDDVIKWKHLPRYWPFVRGIHRSPVDSPHKGQWRGAWMFSVICTSINDWANNRDAGDLKRHSVHYDFTAMRQTYSIGFLCSEIPGNMNCFVLFEPQWNYHQKLPGIT